MDFGRRIPVISAIDPNNHFPDVSNFGAGKVENLRAYFKGKDVKVTNFYTDSIDDRELIDIATNAFLLKNGCIVKIK